MPKHPAKTNAIREVEAARIPFQFRTFECEGAPSGVEVAQMLGEDPDRVFKTLVTQGKSGGHFVFMIPVAAELLPLTGYVHGGCSPVGMKKQFPTVMDETAQLFDSILYSGGRIGCQLETAPDALASLIGAGYADLTV